MSLQLKSINDVDEDHALALTAAVEADSEHIIARALHQAAQEKKLKLPAVSNFEAIKGRGIHAKSNGKEVWVGGPRLLELLNTQPDKEIAEFAKSAGSKGQTVVYLIEEKRVTAAFALADVIRPESYAAIKKLKEMNIQVAMLTGDSKEVAKAVADELGIDLYFAEVLPEHKDQKVIELQKQGKKVAMVGDGVNDAPALVRADVGIAIGSGTDVAVESAGIILVRSNPLDVVKIFKLSRASYRKMIKNLRLGFGIQHRRFATGGGCSRRTGNFTFACGRRIIDGCQHGNCRDQCSVVTANKPITIKGDFK